MEIYQRAKKFPLFYLSHFCHIILYSVIWHREHYAYDQFSWKSNRSFELPQFQLPINSSATLCLTKTKGLTESESQIQMFGKEALSYDRPGSGVLDIVGLRCSAYLNKAPWLSRHSQSLTAGWKPMGREEVVEMTCWLMQPLSRGAPSLGKQENPQLSMFLEFTIKSHCILLWLKWTKKENQ